MVEKDYYPSAVKYYTQKSIELNMSFAVELKITKDHLLPFNCLAIHQEEKLLQAERAYGHKIADVGRLKKPFDIIVLRKAKAVIVAIYYKPGKSEIFEIGIRDFVNEKYTSKNKSLHINRAREIGKLIKL